MKMKKSKFILVPLLLFALILNTIPAFAASSESAAAAQDAEARQINTVTVTFTPSGLTNGIATVYASASGNVEYIKIKITLQEYDSSSGKYVNSPGPSYSSYAPNKSSLYYTHTFDLSAFKTYRIKVDVTSSGNGVTQTETLYQSLS